MSRRRTCRCALLALLLVLVSATARAGDPDDPNAASDPNAPPPEPEPALTLRDEKVESPRAPSRLLETPLSISVVSGEEMQRAQTDTAIDEALINVPGVFSSGGRNFSQDARLAIRGFGANAQFGIRGVRMLVDDIPSTLPDGQTEVDSLELDFVDRMELLRGPVSSLYGGGGGGVVDVETFEPTVEPTVRARATWGSYDLFRASAITTGTVGGTGIVLGFADTAIGGYREHSQARQWNVLGKLERELPGGSKLGLVFSNVTAPTNDEPGALNQAEVDSDRRQAQPTAITQDAGENLDQQKLALTWAWPVRDGTQLRAIAWGLQRDFHNLLTINRAVELDRKAYGGSLVLNDHSGPLVLALGVDVAAQRDLRRNFANLGGTKGPESANQSEDVTAIGPFLQLDCELPWGFGVVAGARYDWTNFDFGDRFVTAASPDQSDQKTFDQISPRVGVRWRHSDAFMAFANLGSAYQVPTTTELQPADPNAPFFAANLDAEDSLGVELGTKGLVFSRVYYGLTLFDLRVEHVAVPFEDPNGLTLFRDAGASRRRGAELEFSAWLAEGLSVRGSYTYASYRYADFAKVSGGVTTQLRGNMETNAPVNMGALELRYDHPSGFFGVANVRYVSKLWVNDENTATAPGATTSDVRVGWDLRRGDFLVEPFFGARNWTGAKYDDRIRPNAAAGRYFEPAPRATIYAGIEVRMGKEAH
jgi:iron complex outermembrane receptor protein